MVRARADVVPRRVRPLGRTDRPHLMCGKASHVCYDHPLREAPRFRAKEVSGVWRYAVHGECRMRSEKLKTEREIEALLRDRIRIVQDDARRDTRTFRITGYRNAARDIAAM